jgi:hypothetical protein
VEDNRHPHQELQEPYEDEAGPWKSGEGTAPARPR